MNTKNYTMKSLKYYKNFEEFKLQVNEERDLLITEVADWDNPKLKKLDRDTVSCHEDEKYEMTPIVNAVKKKYDNQFTDDEIAQALKSCCNSDNQSRQRDNFLNCVYSTLLNE